MGYVVVSGFGAVFVFQNKKCFLDPLIQERFLKIMKVTNVRGDLTGITAEKEPLLWIKIRSRYILTMNISFIQ